MCLFVACSQLKLSRSVASARLFKTFGVVIDAATLAFSDGKNADTRKPTCFYLSLVGGVPVGTVLINVNHCAS